MKEYHESTFYFANTYQVPKPISRHLTTQMTVKENLQLAGKSILIVEDDDLNYDFLHELLISVGMIITRASNGIEAVDLAGKISPELIIMDIRLPLMNGLEATRKIREKGIKVPIIAQTAYAMSEDKEKCLSAGCDDYISKPIHKELLLKKIGYHLYKKSIFPLL